MAKIIINTNNLKHNIEVIKNEYKNKEIIGVIKANAYGHGAFNLAPFLYEFGIKTVAVVKIEEALELLELDINQEILILGPSSKEELVKLDNNKRIIQSINSFSYYDEIKDLNIKKHLNINTGMNRLGVSYEDNLSDILSDPLIEAVYTHFLNNKNEDITINQLNKFSKVNTNLKRHTSLSNKKILDKYNINTIRVGIGMYGFEDFSWSDKLIPIMSLYGKIVNINKVKKGESISYNARYTANKDIIVGTIDVGYSDGISYNYKDGYVYYKDKRCKILGQITMDYIMVDLSDVDYKLYDYVELFGTNIYFREVAYKSNTLPYGILTKTSTRLKKIYK